MLLLVRGSQRNNFIKINKLPFKKCKPNTKSTTTTITTNSLCIPLFNTRCQQVHKRYYTDDGRKDKGTFVSAYFKFDPEQIKGYLTRKNFSFKANPASEVYVVKDCPFCHDTKGKADNLWKLYVNYTSGTFFCHRCSNKGSWFDFQKRLGDIPPAGSFQAAKSSFRPAPEDTDTWGGKQSAFSGPTEAAFGSSGQQSAQGQPGGGAGSSSYSSGSVTLPEQWKLAKTLENLEKFQKVKPYLCGTGKEERHLKPEVLAAYKVGAAIFRFRDDATQKPVDRECVTFPWLTYVHPDDRNKAKDQEATEVHHERVYNAKGEEEDEESTYVEEEPSKQEERPLIMLRMKYRPVEVKDFRLDPPGGQWGLFGWHLVENTDKEEIILTEGEFDAMSVYQGTGKPAVSLPNGASSLPVEIIEMLEPFKRIYLWMDDDVKGQEGAEKFAQKLGKGRCYIVRCSSVPGGKAVKDANDALRAKLDLKLMLKNAAPLPHKQILRFSELRDQIFTELRNPAQVAGTMCRTFPSLNLILKGHRPGELTIVTGHTGVGKTTILSQLSLDYAQQGINTLWGSFEVENVRLIKKMLTQFSGKNLAEHINDFPIFADKFEELPIYFLRFYGSTSIDEVIDAMQYAAYVLDVDHVILDNLQFMSGSTARGYEKFDNIDIAIEKIRKFATDRRVHVTLVIHPKKMDDGIPLTMASVFGTAKATQEADNVIIVQKSPQWRYLEICKNRFDGTLGQIPYKFQEESLRYYELTQMEKIQMERAAGVNNEPPQGNVQGNAPRYFQRGKRNFA